MVKLELPEDVKHLETGIIKVGDDMKSLHLRGDFCVGLLLELSILMTEELKDAHPLKYSRLIELKEMVNLIIQED